MSRSAISYWSISVCKRIPEAYFGNCNERFLGYRASTVDLETNLISFAVLVSLLLSFSNETVLQIEFRLAASS